MAMVFRRLAAPPSAFLALGLGLATGLELVPFAALATAHKPRRVPPAPTSQEVAPDITAAIVKRPIARPSDPPAAPAKADDITLPAPFHLPVASRGRVRHCGLKWQAMKMSGEAGDDIWRDFATRCLAAANGPLETR